MCSPFSVVVHVFNVTFPVQYTLDKMLKYPFKLINIALWKKIWSIDSLMSISLKIEN